MAKMVIRNPALFCTARAEPTASGGLAFADIAENCGESATTKKPHTPSTPKATSTGTWGRAGDSKQHTADPARATRATTRLPRDRLARPPTTQPTAPAAMTPNAPSHLPPSFTLVDSTSAGTRAQKAYSSHMWPKYPRADDRKAGTRNTAQTRPQANPARGRTVGPSPTVTTNPAPMT